MPSGNDRLPAALCSSLGNLLAPRGRSHTLAAQRRAPRREPCEVPLVGLLASCGVRFFPWRGRRVPQGLADNFTEGLLA